MWLQLQHQTTLDIFLPVAPYADQLEHVWRSVFLGQALSSLLDCVLTVALSFTMPRVLGVFWARFRTTFSVYWEPMVSVFCT